MSSQNKPNVTEQAAQPDHRTMYEKLTEERGQWTPQLDECVQAFFQLQHPEQPEETPLQIYGNYGASVGIARSLYVMAQISERAQGQMVSYAATQMGHKLLPWNGCAFQVTSGRGTPPEAPSYH